MAKILTGPLAAGLSGKLGPVVFHQTRFGQIVQSKAKPRTYTTQPAMAAKANFAWAATLFPLLGSIWGPGMAATLAKYGKSANGQIISQVISALNGDGSRIRHFGSDLVVSLSPWERDPVDPAFARTIVTIHDGPAPDGSFLATGYRLNGQHLWSQAFGGLGGLSGSNPYAVPCPPGAEMIAVHFLATLQNPQFYAPEPCVIGPSVATVVP